MLRCLLVLIFDVMHVIIKHWILLAQEKGWLMHPEIAKTTTTAIIILPIIITRRSELEHIHLTCTNWIFVFSVACIHSISLLIEGWILIVTYLRYISIITLTISAIFALKSLNWLWWSKVPAISGAIIIIWINSIWLSFNYLFTKKISSSVRNFFPLIFIGGNVRLKQIFTRLRVRKGEKNLKFVSPIFLIVWFLKVNFLRNYLYTSLYRSIIFRISNYWFHLITEQKEKYGNANDPKMLLLSTWLK